MDGCKPTPENTSFGAASTALGVVSVLVCVIAITLIDNNHQDSVNRSERIAEQGFSSDADGARDLFAIGFNFVEAIVVIGASILVSCTLSAVGLVIGIAGLMQTPRGPALAGILLSVAGPAILFLYLNLSGV